jgi:hypothetical protein
LMAVSSAFKTSFRMAMIFASPFIMFASLLISRRTDFAGSSCSVPR